MGVKWGSTPAIYCNPMPLNISLLQINVDLGAMLWLGALHHLFCRMLWFWRKLPVSHVHVVPELCVAKILESSQFFWGAFMSWTQGSKRT
jgi:hypothetical protein